MAIGMASDTMTGCAPALQDCRSVWIVHALADREQEGACPPQVLQKTLFRFGRRSLGIICHRTSSRVMAMRGRVCANKGVAHRTNALRRVILCNVLTVSQPLGHGQC